MKRDFVPIFYLDENLNLRRKLDSVCVLFFGVIIKKVSIYLIHNINKSK